VIAVARFDVAEADEEAFSDRAARALAALSQRPGYLRGWVARAADDAALWMIGTEWEGPGAYRRALGNADVRMSTAELFGAARNEPTAYEVLFTNDGTTEAVRPSARAADADLARPGQRHQHDHTGEEQER
jgi:hypothetical protein